MSIKKELDNIIIRYVDRVGVRKATDESLYILSKLGYTKPEFIEARAGRLIAVARFRLLVLEYLYGDGEDEEKRLLNAAKDYLNVSKRDYRKGKNK